MEKEKDIDKPMPYKGYIIEPRPEKLLNPPGWALSVDIMRVRGSSVTSRCYYASHRFPTKEEACKRCYEYGMRIIDGQVVGCSVEDL